MWIVVPVLLTLHVAVCLLLVLVVLMQLPRSEGLGAAFGGGVTDNIFGAQTTHVLAKFTVWLGVAFFAITLLLAVAYSHKSSGPTQIERDLKNAPVPAEAALPAVAPVVDQAAPAATPAEVAPVPLEAAAPVVDPTDPTNPTDLAAPAPATDAVPVASPEVPAASPAPAAP